MRFFARLPASSVKCLASRVPSGITPPFGELCPTSGYVPTRYYLVCHSRSWRLDARLLEDSFPILLESCQLLSNDIVLFQQFVSNIFCNEPDVKRVRNMTCYLITRSDRIVQISFEVGGSFPISFCDIRMN